MSKDVPTVPITTYHAPDRTDYKIRAYRDDVLKHTQAGLPLVDVRSPGEYSGQLFHMDGYPQEGSLRTGHIKGAASVPWAKAANPEDGTFKTAEQLRQLYEQEQGLDPSDSIIAYCRIGERTPATPGSCSSICWATQTCGTTTAVGRSGGTWWACRSRSEVA